MQTGAWERAAAVPARRLAGKTAGIIGFGRVGQRVAGLLCAFGVKLLVYDPHVTADEITCTGAEVVTLDDLLERADLVTLHARLTPESQHLLGVNEFARLRPGAILVNTARGGLIDEPALITALQTGRLAAAGLDVMEHEPLAADSPLRRMANVIVSPHVASYSVDAVAQLYRNGAAIAADLLAGAWPTTIVNPQVRPAAEARWAPTTGLGHRGRRAPSWSPRRPSTTPA
jgi:D-3-phosphoglycerate dehydrogenase